MPISERLIPKLPVLHWESTFKLLQGLEVIQQRSTLWSTLLNRLYYKTQVHSRWFQKSLAGACDDACKWILSADHLLSISTILIARGTNSLLFQCSEISFRLHIREWTSRAYCWFWIINIQNAPPVTALDPSLLAPNRNMLSWRIAGESPCQAVRERPFRLHAVAWFWCWCWCRCRTEGVLRGSILEVVFFVVGAEFLN